MTVDPGARPGCRAVLGRRLLRVAAGAAVLIAIASIGLYLRYGGGRPYPDLTGPPLLPEDALEVVVESPDPIGNVAVSADGRLFYTIHPESRPSGPKLLEWVGDRGVPYPSVAAQERFETPLGVVVDRQNRLWTIDHGTHGFGRARLLAFDLRTGEIAHDHAFATDVAQRGSFLQDLQVDSAGETVFVADVSFWRRNPAIVVYDVASRTARRVLESHPSVFPQDWIIRNPIREMVFLGGLVAFKVGVDGIAIDRDDVWLYYGAMTHDTLFRVRTADLNDASLDPATLADRVEAVGKKPLNDGLSTDLEGNVLITDVEHGAVLRMGPAGDLETLVKSDRIRWADALSYGPDGWAYLADSAIPHLTLRSKAHIREHAPYFVFRLRPGIDGIPGQ